MRANASEVLQSCKAVDPISNLEETVEGERRRSQTKELGAWVCLQIVLERTN